jgi:hypothetical protein
VIKEAPESDDAGNSPNKMSLHGADLKAVDLRKKINMAKKRGNRSGVNYSPLFKE